MGDGNDLEDPGEALEHRPVHRPRFPVTPMAVRWAPGIGWALKPRASMARDDSLDLLGRGVLLHHDQHGAVTSKLPS